MRQKAPRRRGNAWRCGIIALILSGLAYGSMTRSVTCVVLMMLLVASYLAYVSWIEIMQLRSDG